MKHLNPIKILFLLSIFFLSPAFADAAILSKPGNNLGLVGHWMFDEGNGTVATDMSGNGNHGTVSGATWGNGKRGKALSFTGTTGSNVSVPDHASLKPTSAVTYALWVKRGAATQNNIAPRILWKNVENPRIYYGSDTTQTVSAILGIGGDITTRIVGVTPTGVWTHVGVTYDGSNIRTYLNGVLANTYPITGTIDTASGALNIGGADTREFNGEIDDVRIYSRALSPTEIAALYSSGATTRKSVSKSGLVAYYSFDDGSGTKAGDSSGNGRDATLSNMDSTASWTNGKKGKGLLFDGDDDIVNVLATVGSQMSTTQGTIMGWMYPTATCTNCFLVFGFGGSNSRYYLKWADSTLQVSRGALADAINLRTSTPLNQWYHLALTWEGGNTFSGYLNGQFISSASFTGDATAPSTITIGKQATNPSFPGTIDEVKFFNRTLTAAEIAAEYNTSSARVNSSQNTKLTDGLVGLWSFNGPDVDDTYVYDRSGQGNHGYFSGVATSSAKTIGKVGQGFATDGVNDYVRVTSSSIDLSSSVNYTESVWVYSNVSDSNYHAIMGFGNINGDRYPSIYVNSQNNIEVYFGYGASQCGAIFTSVLTHNTWNHIAVTFDGTLLTLYINGVSAGTSTGCSGKIPASQTTVRLGASDNFFPGKIDEVRLYNRALTAAEVKQLYLMGK